MLGSDRDVDRFSVVPDRRDWAESEKPVGVFRGLEAVARRACGFESHALRFEFFSSSNVPSG
jgi:hypothetical protein